MVPLAYFGINSSGVNLAIDLLILFFVVLYCSLIYWTYADARRRVIDPMMIGFATAVSLFPFVGTIIYLILRPPEYLEDVRERELEMQAAEARLQQLDYGLCPHCDYQIERDFVRCPSCLRKLKDRCVSCSRPLDRTWTICPYCETEVAGAIPTRRARRREQPATSGAATLSRSGGEGDLGAPEDESSTGRSSLGRDAADDSTISSELGSRPRGTGRASRPRPTP
jgi:Double zinc ribbon